MADHYATLGVARTASLDDIRRAYRARMREAHPDTRGSAATSTASVTQIAEAWNVLSSPSRRAAYDSQFAPTTPTRVEPNLDRVYPPARFPWRFVLTIIGIGAAILLVLHIMGDPMPPRSIDGLISAGSCVNFDDIGSAFEVPCDGPYQARVRELVPFDARCDSDTTQARDRQGMGTVCLEP